MLVSKLVSNVRRDNKMQSKCFWLKYQFQFLDVQGSKVVKTWGWGLISSDNLWWEVAEMCCNVTWRADFTNWSSTSLPVCYKCDTELYTKAASHMCNGTQGMIRVVVCKVRNTMILGHPERKRNWEAALANAVVYNFLSYVPQDFSSLMELCRISNGKICMD